MSTKCVFPILGTARSNFIKESYKWFAVTIFCKKLRRQIQLALVNHFVLVYFTYLFVRSTKILYLSFDQLALAYKKQLWIILSLWRHISSTKMLLSFPGLQCKQKSYTVHHVSPRSLSVRLSNQIEVLVRDVNNMLTLRYKNHKRLLTSYFRELIPPEFPFTCCRKRLVGICRNYIPSESKA